MVDDPRVRQLLEELLDSERTPEEVCQPFPELLPEVRKRWQQICVTQGQLKALFPTQTRDAGTGVPASPNAGAELPRIVGYEVEAVLGRGGMGVVYRARHLRLNRHVALKMLLAGAYADPQELARFQREAEAVASLRHVNIVQVYDVSDYEGRPYFTMEFVEGGTLAQQLRGTPQPPRQAAALVGTLAEAVQVAHHGGIVHRDLKPANVLLTADGTPKISDFGLARRLQGGAGLTQSGAVVGTPSYMAPEQAEGKTSATGSAVDVYALGAILYELVTGRPPFEADTAAATVLRVICEDPAPPVRLNAKVPRDLETVCLKCLQKDPRRRYESAAALGEDLRRFLHGEAIAARPEGRLERLVRTVRRRPTLAVTLAASLLLAAALIGGGLWVWGERAANVRAQERLDRMEQARREREFATRLEAIHLNRAAPVSGRYYRRTNKQRADREYEAAFREAGLGEVYDDPEVVAGRVKASGIRTALVAALDDWAFCATESADRGRPAWLLEVAQRADPDQTGTRQRLRDPAAWKDRAALAELAAASRAAAPAELAVAIGDQLLHAGGDAVPFLTAVQQEHPDNFWANFALGNALMEKNPPEAVRYYQAALAVRPGTAVVYNSLGCALLFSGRLDDAVHHLRQALRIDPDLALAHTNLALALEAKGNRDEAIEHNRQALRIDPELTTAHFNFGKLLHAAGRRDEAIAHYRQAVANEPTYADAHNNLGIALAEAGRRDEAIDHFRQAVAADPKLLMARCNLGLVLLQQGRADEALDHLQQAVDINPKLAQPHGDLGKALLMAGRLRDAQTATRRCLDLLPDDDPRRPTFAQQLKRCERLLALEPRLPAVLRGDAKPAGASECLQFAELCYLKKLFASAAKMYAAAFADQPALADDLEADHRYNAACAAALTGGGQGEEGGNLSEEERTRWRNQSRAWLRADLDAWGKRLGSDRAKYAPQVREMLTHWRVDPDLAGIRREGGMEKWSADERRESATLWKDVDDLLDRAGGAK
jgi:serine/threonine-protein kinase